MKQEVERDGVRNVLVDREGECRCPDSRKDPGSSLFQSLCKVALKAYQGCLPFI